MNSILFRSGSFPYNLYAKGLLGASILNGPHDKTRPCVSTSRISVASLCCALFK
ncbi:hypothetical protein BgiMline_027017, partial [Biomphalaria glabrata]